jgi:hypothetical protein
MIRLRSSAWFLGVVLLTLRAPAGAQDTSPSSSQGIYIESPLPKLQKSISDLHGIALASSQDELPDLLEKTGNVIQDSAKRLPNLTSREDVVSQRVCTSSWSYGGCQGSEQRRQFNYLILPQANAETGKVLEEYRTDLKNRRIDPADPDAALPKGQGYAAIWLVFAPSHRSESAFRYLGRQKISKNQTAYVVAFAQRPDTVRYPGHILLQGKSAAIWYQGLAWIDESSFKILRMRTDLLAPRPEIHLQRLTSEIEFGEVQIANLESKLQLPVKVDLTLEFNAEVWNEVHSYSDYRLYAVETRIVP